MSVSEPHTPAGRARAIAAATRRLRMRTEQVMVAAVVAVSATAISAATGSRPALAVAIAAAAVVCGVAAADALARDRRRQLVLLLIAEGFEDDAHPLIVRERERLLVLSHRHDLAAAIRAMIREPDAPLRLRRPTRGALVVARDELTAVAEALEHGEVTRARGVAMAELLIAGGSLSARVEPDADSVARTLGRIRFVLLSS